MADINFFSQDIPFKIPKPRKAAQWLRQVVASEMKELVQLNYIFCSDNYLLSLNQQYLKHRTLTDIITFDNSEKPGVIEGDVFISLERVKENAQTLRVGLDEEIHRVLVHGVLHLAGHSDKTTSEKRRMREKEDAYLSLRT
jgi:rRNA maturation RNase YbeY